jgi:hypothetical protein
MLDLTFTTFSAKLESSQTIGNTTYAGGIQASMSAKSGDKNSGTSKISVYGQFSSGDHTKRTTYTMNS